MKVIASLLPLLSAASTVSYGPFQDIQFQTDSAVSQQNKVNSDVQSRCPLIKLREDVRTRCGMTALMSCPASLSPQMSLLSSGSSPSSMMPPISFYAMNEQFNIQMMMDDMLNLSFQAFDEANAVSVKTAQDGPVEEKNSVEENPTADEISSNAISSEMWGDSLEEELNKEPLDEVTEEEQLVGEIDPDQGLEDKASYDGTNAEPATAAEDTMDEIVASLFRTLGVVPVEEHLEPEDIMSPLPTVIDFPALDNLPIFLFQFGNGLLMDGQRRRLSEGEADPHSEIKERLGRRLTEYVHMETYSTPDGGIVILSSNPPPAMVTATHNFNTLDLGSISSVPFLGFGTQDVDSCIFSMFKNNDLSGGCHDSVHSLLDMHARMVERNTKMIVNMNSDSSTVDDGSNVNVASPALAFYFCLLVVAMCTSAFLLCTRCMGMDDNIVLHGVLLLFISILTFGWMSLVVTLPTVLTWIWLGDDSEEVIEDEEDTDEFDGYVKCPGDDSEEKSSGKDPVVCVGVPIQVV